MDFDKFSISEFQRRGLNSTSSRKLADELEEAALQEIHSVLMPTMNKIIDELNKRGHQLTFYEDPIPGDISYRHKDGDGEMGLRIAVDTIISTGYSHLYDNNQSDEEIIEEVVDNLCKLIEPTDLI
ncbi:hypothetical protein C1752_03527 [Acaryochloris thomasi RCC1774]|uniref:Uncharacterized protein n=1 Tax=Acaryochloris thomasi RCC1774 TaxID=1764569 RepID=A0A2W1JV98_9CYAN|nr:hypothetical protein [Acaryochloris thomasi]PZD72691.1 hypothetical protein C1752_03527 [Acaryochloris thomasi RCC1774]